MNKNKDVSFESHNLIFGIKRSILYHKKRFLFLSNILSILYAFNTALAFCIIILDVNIENIIIYIYIITILDLIYLMFNPDIKRYEKLMKDFKALYSHIIDWGINNRRDLEYYENRRLEIERREPKILRILDIICHNELIIEGNYDKNNIIKLSFFQRICAHFFDYNLELTLRKCNDKRKKSIKE